MNFIKGMKKKVCDQFLNNICWNMAKDNLGNQVSNDMKKYIRLTFILQLVILATIWFKETIHFSQHVLSYSAQNDSMTWYIHSILQSKVI